MLYSFVRQFGLQDSVMTLDELSSGDDVKDTGVAAAAVNCAKSVSHSLLTRIEDARPPNLRDCCTS